MSVVTRFAPSPTGYLHIGGARTALFSWLHARNQGGKFLLRIEDTDRQRSTPEATQAILDAMEWLGLDHDGETVFQSERTDIHNRHVDRLLEEGKAYWCDCTPEQVEAMREKARSQGKKPKYDNSCREKDLGPGPGRVVRFKTPLEGRTSFLDTVKGPTTWENAELDDMILRRSDGSPTYNLAVVVDDHDMGVTTVLRGDDHVANTPRQILLYQAFGWEIPTFGHVPMILGQDKKKLSKRHGALSVMEYEKMGYLPEAVVNYLVRLGWSRGDEEIFSREELVEHFTLSGLSSSPSAFDLQKLDWMDAHYIKEGDPVRLAGLLGEFLKRAGAPEGSTELRVALVPLLQPRAKTLADMADKARVFTLDADELDYDQKAVEKFLTPEARDHLSKLLSGMESLEDFTEKPLEDLHAAYLEKTGIKFKTIAQPIRVAITGSTQSPGLFETMAVLGKDQVVKRIKRALSL